MTDEDTARLVNVVISTWPTGPRGYVWTDVLRPMEYACARSAYLDLRDTEERPPSVARFVAAYTAQRRAAEAPAVPAHCELCDGGGWVEVAQAHNPRTCRPDEDHPCHCSAVEPCRCSTGQERGDAWRRHTR